MRPRGKTQRQPSLYNNRLYKHCTSLRRVTRLADSRNEEQVGTITNPSRMRIVDSSLALILLQL